MATIFGESQPTDYTAKRFSLVTGAVILNPFDFRRVMDPGSPDRTAEPEFELGRGTREANGFIEAGFRRRWAWLDRLGPASAARAEAFATADPKDRDKLRAAEHELAAAREREAAAVLRERATTTDSERAAEEDTSKQRREDRESAERQVELIRDKIVGRAELMAIAEWREARDEPRFCLLCKCVRAEGGHPLIPTDWTIRGGFVFGQDTSLEASSLAGGSDFYTEGQVGWNLVRWSMPTVSPEETPIRASFNFEFKGELVTDRDLVDVHERVLIGPAAAVGVPLGLRSKDDDNAADPIVEFFVHVGATQVEVPRFVDRKSRLVEVKNEVPDFNDEWGVGVDAEINVPISKPLGYFMMRTSINAGFSPNPWTVRLGYTVPLSTLATAAGLKTGS